MEFTSDATAGRDARSRLRVAVADSVPLMDAAFRALVAMLPGIDAVQITAPDKPDVVILHCPDPADLQYLADAGSSGIPVVLVAARWTGEQASAALAAGARGCLSGSTTTEWLAAALRQVWRGEVALSPEVAQAVLAGLGIARRAPVGPALSPRELEVIGLVCAGHGNKEIAQRLYLSLRTVENHLAAAYAKLGVASRTEAAILAIRTGLVEMPEPWQP